MQYSRKILFSLIAGLLICSASFANGVLTQEAVQKMNDEFAVMNNKQNVDGVIKFISPTAEILFKMIAPGTPMHGETIKITPEQYADSMRTAWGMTDQYSYTIANEQISVSADGQSATITADVTEEMTINGQSQKASTHEVITVELVEGQLLMTKINYETTMPNQ